MGRYGTLTAGADHLEFFASLDSDRQTESETAADLQLDELYIRFDRSVWDGNTIPRSPEDVWKRMAAAEYIERDIGSANPSAPMDGGTRVASLRQVAMQMAEMQNKRGWVINRDGEKEYPIGGPRDASDFMIEVVF
jgi:hypothetical protein